MKNEKTLSRIIKNVSTKEIEIIRKSYEENNNFYEYLYKSSKKYLQS